MKIALFAGLALLAQLLLFLCAGSALMKLRGRKAWSLSASLLLGYFFYFCVFELVCLIAEVTLTSLGRLAVIMLVIDAVLIIAGTVYCGKDWILRLRTLHKRIKEHGFLLAFVIAACLAVCLFALIYTDASADSDHYVGMASTALFTNSIGRFDPASGMFVRAIKPRYAYALYPYHNAVMADLFRIPAVVQARTVMNVINAFISCLAIYHLGLALFGQKTAGAGAPEADEETDDGSSIRRAELFTLLVLLLHAFSSTIYLPGIFLFSRSYEGKNLIANLVLPAVFGAAALIWRGKCENRKELFADLFFVILAGVCFSSSVVVPVMLLSAALIPCMLLRKDFRLFRGLLFSILPALAWAALYVLNSHQVFVLLTYR